MDCQKLKNPIMEESKGDMSEQRQEIEKLMQQLTREQLKEYLTYLKALAASAGQH